MRRFVNFVVATCTFACGCLPLRAQVQPIPLPGGDLISPYGLFSQFFPGIGSIYDGRDADPHGIINSDGIVAMGTLRAQRTTTRARFTMSSPISAFIREPMWERWPMTAQEGQFPRRRMAPSWRYDWTSTTPVRGHSSTISTRESRPTGCSGLYRSPMTQCRSLAIRSASI